MMRQPESLWINAGMLRRERREGRDSHSRLIERLARASVDNLHDAPRRRINKNNAAFAVNIAVLIN